VAPTASGPLSFTIGDVTMDETLAAGPELLAEHDAGASSVASERVTSAIRNAILTGRFAPGSRIRQEELAREFGISRLPVRLALRRLESEGLVTLVPNSGAWIAKLDLAECIEVYKMRERLEPLALAESTPLLPDDAIRRMEGLADAMEAGSDLEEFVRLDREFHLLSYQSSGMPKLVHMIERFWNSTQQYRRAFAGIVGVDRLDLVHYEHRLMLAALRRRDHEEAERILYGHIRRTRLELQRHPEIFDSAARIGPRRSGSRRHKA
jgi:DNA-binding GntR family transcriptional regulator